MRCTGFVKVVALLGCIVAGATAQEGGSPDELTSTASKAIESLLLDPKQSARIANGEADKVVAVLPDAHPGVKKYDLLDAAFRVLKPEVKQQPEHALKARLLAAIARVGRQRTADVAKAEELDLLLNPDRPDAWLRRGISYVKAKEDKWAADMFLEALKRTDFARPPEFFSTLAPPTTGWVARIAKAQRTDELNAALGEAFTRTRQGTAGPMAFSMLQAVLDVEDTPKQPQRLESVLKSVREHQQHLLLAHMAQFQKLVFTWERAGHQDAATTLARALLLTPSERGENSPQEAGGEVTEQLSLRELWGVAPDYLDHNGLISSLAGNALREPNENFFAEAEKLVRTHPRDAHLISTVLLLKSYRAPVTTETLQLAQGLDPASRPQVAWRLAVLSLSVEAEPTLLTSWCEEGMTALVQRPDRKGDVGANIRQAMQILPWLERHGRTASFPTLIPLFRERMVRESAIGDGAINRDLWPSLLVLAARYGNPKENEACAKEWQVTQARRRAGTIEQEWNECRRALRVLVSGMSRVPQEQGKPLARLAFEMWCSLWPRSMKEGSSDSAVAMLVQDALLSANLTEELAIFEKQVSKEITFGRSLVFQPILERLQWYHEVMNPEGAIVPRATVKLVNPTGGEQGLRVAWELAVQTQEVERLRLEFLLSDEVRAPVEVREQYESPPLHALSGRYVLEVYAGETKETLRKVGEAQAVPVQGDLVVKGLPEAGWVRVVMREPRNGAAIFEEPELYCLRRTVLDSRNLVNPPALAWGANQMEEYGTPNTQPISIEPDAEYLLRVEVPEAFQRHYSPSTFPGAMCLVALDADRQPIGKLTGLSGTDLMKSAGKYMALISPDRWGSRDGDLYEVRDAGNWDGMVKPRYLVITTRNPGAQPWPVSLQIFRQSKAAAAAEKLPELKAEFLALTELEARTWFVSNSRPRAAVGGPGGIKVYDTSVTPWRLVKHLDSKALLGHESVFLFRDDELICLEWPCEGRPQAALRIVPLNSELAYEAHERRVLPMNPLRSEVAVDESGAILTAPSEGSFRTRFRALWLSADGKVLEATTERPAVEGASEVTVAWWGKDGTLGVSEGGRMFHLKVTPQALTVEKQEPGVASFETVPPGAEPSSHLWQPRFLLKEGNLLLRLDQKTGELQTGYWLPYHCRGSVIWMSDVNSPALLTTDQGELIRVAVPGK
ncbi:hypothetical protein DES53_102116 [Roseimicrobium gellanilyticum]|uniref:WD40 repeat protein n=1 Tax=Roseimicrobium gellanilyticum TaxID=748857 RepID=A0A366HS35_9BACT|nr:hypothetical protein [Roseimicrobium gellanilyticum]RBP45734.1 hypothetical protein DES53_102116 [Roseimicrobium gellanilyticum]